jgi:protein TonB
MEEHQVVASAAIPKKAAKANNSWVGESLHRRISELRHYPSTARLNGWEGKVVLKVSIRNDGHLNSVEVVKSSGYESLDQAAIEAVRRACPLHMKHELSSEMVVLTLPVSYSLNR